MPEGHLLHHYAQRHRSALAGRPVAASSPQGRFAAEASRLDGKVLQTVEATGKHLFYVFTEQEQVHVHLGQRGTLLELGAEVRSPSATRLRLAAGPTAVHLIAPTLCEVIDRAGRQAVEAKLGPDPLDPDADPEAVVDALTASSRAIGALLLDQSVVAGIGNVLRSEILNVCGIDPRRPASSLERDQLAHMWAVTVEVMTLARDLGSIVTRGSERQPDERDGRFAYKRETCARCGTPIEHVDVGGRTAYVCGTCQR